MLRWPRAFRRLTPLDAMDSLDRKIIWVERPKLDSFRLSPRVNGSNTLSTGPRVPALESFDQDGDRAGLRKHLRLTWTHVSLQARSLAYSNASGSEGCPAFGTARAGHTGLRRGTMEQDWRLERK